MSLAGSRTCRRPRTMTDGLAVRAGLSLCSGIAGLDLAMRFVYGDRYRCVGHVEREAYAAAVLVARMDEQALDRAPIWDDLRTFPSGLYRGRVDIVTAGFPCQPFSVAGKQRGTLDDRWLWPQVWDVTRTVDAVELFIENVPGFRTRGLEWVLGDLAEAGWSAEWCHLRAFDVGAPHVRNRFFLLAHADEVGRDGRPGSVPRNVADADGADVRVESGRGGRPDGQETAFVGDARPFPPGPGDVDGWGTYTGPQPGIQRSPHGSAAALERSDRLRACGNAVVPVVAARAYRALRARLTEQPNNK